MRNKFKLNVFGISLIECMVVIVIIGIMLLIWRFTSKGHEQIAIANEGYAFIEKVVAQERIYRTTHSDFLPVGKTSKNDSLKINAYDNKYFSNFSVEVTADGIKVFVYGNTNTKAKDMQIYGTYNSRSNQLEYKESW